MATGDGAWPRPGASHSEHPASAAVWRRAPLCRDPAAPLQGISTIWAARCRLLAGLAGGKGGEGGEPGVGSGLGEFLNGGGQWEQNWKTLPAVPSAVVPGVAVGPWGVSFHWGSEPPLGE